MLLRPSCECRASRRLGQDGHAMYEGLLETGCKQKVVGYMSAQQYEKKHTSSWRRGTREPDDTDLLLPATQSLQCRDDVLAVRARYQGPQAAQRDSAAGQRQCGRAFAHGSTSFVYRRMIRQHKGRTDGARGDSVDKPRRCARPGHQARTASRGQIQREQVATGF